MELDLDNWLGNRNNSSSKQITSNDLTFVIEQLDKLDQKKHTQLIIGLDDGYYMTSGGLGRYVCTYTQGDNEAFFNLVNPSTDNIKTEEIEVVTGGQAGLFPHKIVVDKDLALQALSYFVMHQQMDLSLIWEED
jgi:hypothetical protein